MRVVVVGDLAWKGRYHLGDEAMSEVALQELRSRGAEVIFIAGDPQITSNFYDVHAVSRFGFGSIRARSDKDHHINEILAYATDGGDPPVGTLETIEVIKNADAVLIAGGGNLNSIGIHHIYERLTVKRLAAHYKVPLYVTSQTVGPHLLDSERPLIAEIINYATVFGVRESSSAALVRALSSADARVVHTLDDAILLRPSKLSAEMSLPKNYAVASFTFHSRTTGKHPEEYYQDLALAIDELAKECNIEILLLPHMSTFESPNPLGVEDDKYAHDRIQNYSSSKRIHSLPLMPAGELLSVTSAAEFSISTRYHPLIFGSALGVPAIGLVTSFYSAIRMRGALANVGMESFAIPFEYWNSHFGGKVTTALQSRGEEFRTHLKEIGTLQKAYQSSWWDGLFASMSNTGDPQLEDCLTPSPISWGNSEDLERLSDARIAHESLNRDRLNQLLAEESTKLRDRDISVRLKRAEADLRDLKDQAIPEIRHRLRPPGAALRDRVRLALRRTR